MRPRLGRPGRRAVRRLLRNLLRRVPRAGWLLTGYERALSVSVISRSGLFDAEWYAAQTGRGYVSAGHACAHYVFRGRLRGLSPHPLVEPEWYDPDGWRVGAADPFAVYLQRPDRWAASTSPLFDPGVYARSAPGASRHRYGPLAYFLATAQAGTPLPAVPVPGSTGRPTWGPTRERLVHRARAWRRQEQLRDAGSGSADDRERVVDGEWVVGGKWVVGGNWVVDGELRVDWDATGRDRVDDRVSVLIPTFQDWRMTRRAVLALLLRTTDAATELEIVVLDNGSRRAVSSLLEALAAMDPRLRVLRAAVNLNFGPGSNVAFAASTGATVIFLNNDTEVRAGWLEPLLQALAEPGALAAQPLLLYPDGTVQCAGIVFPSAGTLPGAFLAHHPADDAVRLGSFPVAAGTGAALAVRAGDVAALRGFDPVYVNGWEDVDFCLRLGRLRPGHVVITTASTVVHHESRTPGRFRHVDANRALFRRRWEGRTPRGDERLWERAGLRVAHYATGGEPGSAAGLPVPRPVVVRDPRRVAAGPAAGLPALRWAIKTAAPARPAGRRWGDEHFARALAAALGRLGQDVVVDPRESHVRPTGHLDDVVLTLRGLQPVRPQAGRVNLIWVISHPDQVDPAELDGYDAVYAAGQPWAGRMTRELGRTVEVLLQCTDATRFRPEAGTPDTGPDLLFVGNSRNAFRPVVHDALAAGFPVRVYGMGWDQFLSPRHLAGTYLPYERLPAAYRCAGVLLNDHWADMRREGFVSNRLFDATAAAARVISDDVPGLVALFGAAARTYRSVADLRDLLGRPRDEVFPGEEERLRLSQWVRREHSFDARARVLLDAAVRLREGHRHC